MGEVSEFEMIATSSETISKLLDDIGGSFIAPVFVLCLGFANSRLPFNSWDREFRMKLTLTFSVSLFLLTISVILIQDRTILVDLWKDGPILYSFVYLICSTLAISGIASLIYWKLRPQLWRKDHHKSS